MPTNITLFILAAVRHLGFVLTSLVLHPVIDFHGHNIVLDFHVDWFGSFHTSLTYAQLVTATDRQTDIVKT